MTMRFLIVTACRNCHDISRCIESVCNQTHEQWQMIVIDDASTDDTTERAEAAAGMDRRIRVIRNGERRFALANILDAIWKHGHEEDVIVTLDGDDRLSDRTALREIAAEYDRTGADALWTRYQTTDGAEGISREMHGDPISCGWTMSHLRTFRKPLIHGIRPDYWTDPETGQPWACAYDQALYRPILKLARKPVFFPRVCCIYKEGEAKNHDNQLATAKRVNVALQREFDGKAQRNVCFIVNGRCQDSDPRFHQGETRPPLGVLGMAAVLQARGHTVNLIDRYAKPLAWDAAAVEAADVIGLSCTTPNHADAVGVLSSLSRNNSGKLLLAGGPDAILHPDRYENLAHLIAPGEADWEIINMVERGTVDPMPVRLKNLDALPLPAYGLALRHGNNYTRDWHYNGTQDIINMNTSRSCPHGCTFCDVRKIFGRAWHSRSPERVVMDMDYLLRKYQAGGIYFREDNFCCSRERLLSICYLIRDHGLVSEWACEIRADMGRDPEVAEAMAMAGCVGWYIGAESGSDRMLELYRKGITREDTIQACANARAHGIQPILSIIEKHPAEKEVDRMATESMIEQCKPRRTYRCDYRED